MSTGRVALFASNHLDANGDPTTPHVALAASNSTYTSGTVVLSGNGNLTVSYNGQTVLLSAAAGAGGIGGIAVNGLTTYTSGTVVLSAGNNITLGTNAQTVTISGVAAQTVQTQNMVALSASNNLFSSGTVVISGFGDVTVNTAAGTIRISAPVQTAQTGISALYDGANSISSGTVRLTDANGVTFSLNANTLSASVNQSLSMFAVSNTTQSSSGTAHKSALSFAGAGIASVGVTGGTVVISVPSGGGAAATRSGLNPYQDIPGAVGALGQGTLQFDPIELEEAVQFDRVAFGLNNTNSSNSSGSHTLSFWVGLYTRNAATLNLLQSMSSSTALTHSGTAGSYSLYSGLRLFTIPFTTTLTSGEYWLGFLSRTTSGGANGSYSNLVGSYVNSNFLGFFGSSHNTTYQLTLGQGVYTVTTNGMPAAVSFSQIRGSDSMVLRAPFVMFASSTV